MSSQLHKTRRRRRPRNPVVQVLEHHDRIELERHGKLERYSVTYQLELVTCGKPRCLKRHGPYWYAYWTMGRRTRSLYIGKERRPASEVLADLAVRRRTKGKAHVARN
jgi:hypothetical protein